MIKVVATSRAAAVPPDVDPPFNNKDDLYDTINQISEGDALSCIMAKYRKRIQHPGNMQHLMFGFETHVSFYTIS